MKSNKLFNSQGFLTEEGAVSDEIVNFQNSVKHMMKGLSRSEARIMESILKKLVADLVLDLK
jgi:hypothetical protein